MFFEKRKLCGNHFIVAGSLWEGATRAARAARAREQQQQQRAAVAATRFESLTYKFAFSTLPISTRIAPEIAPSSSLRSPSPLSPLPSPPLPSAPLPTPPSLFFRFSPRAQRFTSPLFTARSLSRASCRFSPVSPLASAVVVATESRPCRQMFFSRRKIAAFVFSDLASLLTRSRAPCSVLALGVRRMGPLLMCCA